jgi:predicted nucleotidyltransferase
MDTLPENIPIQVRQLLDALVSNFRTTLDNNLTGVYLHGSAAMGCYNPVKSDIDLLIVVKDRVNVEQKRAIIRFLLALTEQAPKKGIELSIVTLDALQHFQFPTPYELHFSNTWIERYTSDGVDFEQQRFDSDLAAHVVVTKKRGLCLYGEPVEGIFPDIPEAYYLRSIVGDAEDIFENIAGDPMYGVLNLCRVLAFIKEKAVCSKLEGGNWGMQHITSAYQPLIHAALQAYQSTSGNDASWDKEPLQEFASYMKQQIEGQYGFRV